MSITSSTYQAAWAGLEMRHLLALMAVVETGTFSKAAEQLGYTQSAVSQQVATLERMVSTPLFERPGGPRPVRLTAAGEMLLTHARAVLARVSSAATDLRALASGEQGELRVGTLPSVGTKILPRLLGTFRAEWPGIQIVLRESRDSAELLHAVEAGDIDVTFIDIGPYETGPLEVRPLLDDPMVFLAPAGAPEAGQPTVSIADIAHLPMIGTRNIGCRQIVDAAFRQAPGSPRYVFRSDDHPTIQGLIGSGMAYAAAHGGRARSKRGRRPHQARAHASPARDRMASRPPAAARPDALCRGGGRNLSRPRRAVGGVARRMSTPGHATPSPPRPTGSPIGCLAPITPTPVPTCPQGTSATSAALYATSAATTGRRERQATSRAHGYRLAQYTTQRTPPRFRDVLLHSTDVS